MDFLMYSEDKVIEINNLSKVYQLYRQPSDRLRQVFFPKLQRLLRLPEKKYFKDYCALNNLSLTINHQTVLGVIGNNGAGKSTFLQLLCGTLRPSGGSVDVSGRVAALLELGAGFNPEFTGRENVLLTGMALGLSKSEINNKYQEIVDFSGIGDFIDQPAKTYSSGMFVRLAFAVATSVNPDVLVIDEALSVGDQSFQKKSLDKIRSFIDEGKTVVFCSHNLYQVKSLCNQALWLDKGIVKAYGDVDSVVDQYQSFARQQQKEKPDKQAEIKKPVGVGPELLSVELQGQNAHGYFDLGDHLIVAVVINPKHIAIEKVTLGVVIMRNDNVHAYGVSTEMDQYRLSLNAEGKCRVNYHLDELQLLAGEYTLYVYLLDESGIHIYDMRENVLPFTVKQKTREMGMSRLSHRWEIVK